MDPFGFIPEDLGRVLLILIAAAVWVVVGVRFRHERVLLALVLIVAALITAPTLAPFTAAPGALSLMIAGVALLGILIWQERAEDAAAEAAGEPVEEYGERPRGTPERWDRGTRG